MASAQIAGKNAKATGTVEKGPVLTGPFYVLRQPIHHLQYLLSVRKHSRSVSLPMAHHPFLVHYYDRPGTRSTLLVPEAVGLRGFAFGMEVRELRIVESTH